MRLTDIYRERGENTISFEIFPPKKDEELKNIDAALEILAESAECAVADRLLFKTGRAQCILKTNIKKQ